MDPGHQVKDMRSSCGTDLPVLPAHTEPQITDPFLSTALKGEVLESLPIQKQSHAGQWTGTRLWSLLGTMMVMLVLVSHAPRRLLQPSRDHHLGQALHCPYERQQGNKTSKLHTVPCTWFCVGASHSCPKKHGHCLCSCAQKATNDGQY